MGSNKYVHIWQQVLPEILRFLAVEGNGTNIKIPLNKDVFWEVGNRISSGYTFRLDIVNCDIPRKSGSAVARDLKEVLDNSDEFRRYVRGKNLMIRLDSKFVLHIHYFEL